MRVKILSAIDIEGRSVHGNTWVRDETLYPTGFYLGRLCRTPGFLQLEPIYSQNSSVSRERHQADP